MTLKAEDTDQGLWRLVEEGEEEEEVEEVLDL